MVKGRDGDEDRYEKGVYDEAAAEFERTKHNQPSQLVARAKPREEVMAAVGQALDQLRAGEPVTATCPTCGRVLVAEAVDVTGALVIRCPDGHTVFRRVAAPALVPGTSK